MSRKKKQIATRKISHPKNLDEVFNMFKGKGGGPDAESILNDSKLDKDTVSVWSCKHDVSKIIERCGKDIKSFQVTFTTEGEPSGCLLEINRKVFRGIVYAFKHSK